MSGKKKIIVFTENDMLDIYNAILNESLNIRKIALKLNCSKSTLHSYIHSDEFKFIINKNNLDLLSFYNKLKQNYNNKHIIGGRATKEKYLNKKERA